MKSNFLLLFAAVAAQDANGDITPLLDALESYCKETYGLPAYATRGKTKQEFADLWMNRCTKQRNKLEKVYNKVTQKGESCGSFDESYLVEFKTIPSALHVCQALSEVTAEYNRFATTFLTNDKVCGVKRRSKLQLRMEIMQKQLTNKAECDCIDYRKDYHCSGDLIQQTTIEPSPNGPSDTEYEAIGGYGVCASLCIGVPGCVSFNWILNDSGSGSCELYSSVTKCDDPGLTSAENYGNGLIKFTEKSFCSNGVCESVTVCRILTRSGDENYYIPLDGTLNESRANGANGGHGKVEGYTKYDAIRLIENDNGLFIKLNDPTFSRSSLKNKNHEIIIPFLPFTYVSDCKKQMTTSTANLNRTPIKFSPSVLPYTPKGWIPQGSAVLSSDNQAMTITNYGSCSENYFTDCSQIDCAALHALENTIFTEDHLLSVTF